MPIKPQPKLFLFSFFIIYSIRPYLRRQLRTKERKINGHIQQQPEHLTWNYCIELLQEKPVIRPDY